VVNSELVIAAPSLLVAPAMIVFIPSGSVSPPLSANPFFRAIV
jgi:hypothetical protein